MGGFDAAQVGFFDPQAVSGFERNHVTGMELGALAGFDVGQVRNLEPDAIHGIGDKVPAFDDFDFDVRKELAETPGLRLGGVGSFDDLVNRLVTDAGTPPTAEELQQLGWDSCLKSELDFGSLEGSAIPEGFGDSRRVQHRSYVACDGSVWGGWPLGRPVNQAPQIGISQSRAGAAC